MNVTKVGIQSERLLKESRIHCCSNGCRQRDNAEQEGYDRALTGEWITENNITNAILGLLQVFYDVNFRSAVYRTVRTMLVCCERHSRDGGRPSGRDYAGRPVKQPYAASEKTVVVND